MRKPDYAHKLTDEQLAELERRIANLYKEAADELTDTVKAYFEQFIKRDAAMKEKLDAGEITEQQYKQWRLAQIGRGKRFEALRDKVAERYTDANATAVAYVNDATPGIYSLNRNYSAYKIEQVSDKADFTLWDEQTVKRLIVEQPDLMPYYPPKRALQRGIDLKYGKQQITASVTSSILQGKSIPKIANDLQSRMQNMSRTSAIRTARTAVTGAQNAGRLDTYRSAQDMGIKLKKRWLATLDNRTRHAHAMLDGQTVDIDKPFKVDGYELMYPGDSSAPGYLVYNCRCTQIAEVDGEDTGSGGRRAIDPETGESVLVEDMTYAEWAGRKKQSVSVFDSVPVKYRDKVMQNYNSAPPEIRKAWEKCADKLNEPKFDISSGAHFSPSDRCTHYQSQEKAYGKSNYQEENAVFFHEYGHNIDFILGGGKGSTEDYYSVLYKDREFGKSIAKECEEGYKAYWYASKGATSIYDVVKSVQNSYGGMGIEGYIKEALREKLPIDKYRVVRKEITAASGNDTALKAIFDKYLLESEEKSIIFSDKSTAYKFCKDVKDRYDIYERTDVSDIYEKFMVSKFDIAYPFGVGHGKNYCNEKDNTALEAFAEMYSATATNNKSLEVIKTMFPESYKIFTEMLKEV